MKKIYLFLLAIACPLAFVGCSDDDDTTAMVLEIVSSDIGFDAAGGTGSISLRTSENTIDAVSNKSWLTVTDVTSSAVLYSVAENADALQRSAKITISAGTMSREVTVLQNGALFDISAQNIEMDPAGQTPYLIEYDTSMSSVPEVLIPQDAQQWLSATVENGAVKLTAILNYTSARSTVITITQGWKPVEITVTQEMVDLLDVEELSFDREQATVTVVPTEYLALAASSWDVITDDAWITVSKNGNESFTVTVSENTTGSLRTGTIDLKSADGQVLFSLPVSQKIYSYEFFLGTWTMNYTDSETQEETSLTVTLSATEDRTGYTMNGLRYNGLAIGYDDSGSSPKLTMLMQYIGYNGTYYVYLCPWDADAGYYTWQEGTGADLVYNMNETEQALIFQDNGAWSRPVNSFMIYAFTSYPAVSGGGAGSYARYPFISSFTR